MVKHRMPGFTAIEVLGTFTGGHYFARAESDSVSIVPAQLGFTAREPLKENCCCNGNICGCIGDCTATMGPAGVCQCETI